MTPSDPAIRGWEAEYPEGKGHAVVHDYEAAMRFSVSNHGSRIHPLVRALTAAEQDALVAWARLSPRPAAAESFPPESPAFTVAVLFERVEAA